MKRIVTSFILCSILVLLCMAAVYAAIKLKPEPKQEVRAERPPTNVHVQVLEPVTIEDVLLLTGRVAPWEAIVLSAEGLGNIEWQGVEAGDRVTKGQELVHIDTSQLRIGYDQAAARKKLAEQELQRAIKLEKNDVAPPQALDRAQADYDVAKADLAAARLRLDKSIIYAPFDGIVDAVYKEEGEFADTGMALLHLIQVHKVKAHVGIPERDIVYFDVKDTIQITLDALPGQSFEGTIYKIASSGDLQTRTFDTEIMVDNADNQLKPGMTIRARLIRTTFPEAIAVPIFSVISVENQRFVAVDENNTAQIRKVEVGVLQGNKIHITQGLQAGNRLIVSGHRDLRPGAAINVTEEVTP